MEFQYVLRTLRKRWKQIATVFMLTLIASGVFTSMASPSYQAVSKLYISTSGVQGQLGTMIAGEAYSRDRVKTYNQLVQTPGVLEPVSEKLGYRVWGGQVVAKSPGGTVLINITATASTGQASADIANEVSLQLARVIQQLETPLQAGTESPVKASVVQSAPVPANPSSPRPRFNYMMGGLLGLILSAVHLRDECRLE